MSIPFSKSELTIMGKYGNAAILNTPITPRENFIRAIRHQNPLWIPMKTDSINFAPRIYQDNIARAFVVEANRYEGIVGGKDIFGVSWIYVPKVGGSMVKPGKPFLNDISEWEEKIYFPDLEVLDWQASADENNDYLKNSNKLVEIWIFNGFFERLISFLDFEDAAVALIDEDQQEDVHKFFCALTDFYKKLIDKFAEYYAIDAIYFHDDWGSQRAPFFSIETCREMLVPYLKELVDHVHSKGLLFDFHSCGKCDELAPAMVECGMDMWGGQPMNDKPMLIDTYGKDILIGIHDLYRPGVQAIPDDDKELYRQVEEFLEPISKEIKMKPFYIANLRPDDRVIAAFYECTRKLLNE